MKDQVNIRPNFDEVGSHLAAQAKASIPVVPKTDREVAHGFLDEAGKAMAARAQLRDQPGGERSMERIVATFNSLTGHNLTTAEGWEFMILLKMVRGRQGFYNRDDYVDGAAYFGLLGEEESSNDDRRRK